MTKDEYVDHEVRIRLMEQMVHRVDNKMNTGLMLIIGSILTPIALKWFGWV